MNMTTPRALLRHSIAIAIFAAFAMSLATVSSAAEIIFGNGSEAPRAIVKYADLDIESPQGAAVVYDRIRVAARGVCEPLEGSDLGSKMHKANCVRKAIADAVKKVDQQAVFAVYARR